MQIYVLQGPLSHARPISLSALKRLLDQHESLYLHYKMLINCTPPHPHACLDRLAYILVQDSTDSLCSCINNHAIVPSAALTVVDLPGGAQACVMDRNDDVPGSGGIL